MHHIFSNYDSRKCVLRLISKKVETENYNKKKKNVCFKKSATKSDFECFAQLD